MATVTYTDNRPIRSPFTLRIGVVIASALLTMLIINPALLYYDDLDLFTISGITINVRFLLLLTTCALAALAVVVSKLASIPLPLLLFTLFFGMSVIVAIIQGLSMRWWLPPLMRWSGSILIAWAGYLLVRKGHLNVTWFQRALIIAICIPMAFGIVQLALGTVPLLNGAYRVYGPFVGSPLNYALFLAGLALLVLGQPRIHWHSMALVGIAGALLIATHSRLVIAAFGVSIGILLLLQRRYLLVFLAGVGAVAMLILSDTLAEQLIGRFRTILTINGEVLQRAPLMAYLYQWTEANIDNSVLLRIQTHYVGWEAFTRSPIFGNGLGSFVPLYEARTGRPDIAAHNDYLLYLVETGLVGIVFYIGLQLWITWWLLRPPPYIQPVTRALSLGVGIAYICINVFSFLANSYYFFEVQFWIWLGFGVVLALRRTDMEQHLASNARSVPTAQ
jgi:O-antigen ligase